MFSKIGLMGILRFIEQYFTFLALSNHVHEWNQSSQSKLLFTLIIHRYSNFCPYFNRFWRILFIHLKSSISQFDFYNLIKFYIVKITISYVIKYWLNFKLYFFEIYFMKKSNLKNGLEKLFVVENYWKSNFIKFNP